MKITLLSLALTFSLCSAQRLSEGDNTDRDLRSYYSYYSGYSIIDALAYDSYYDYGGYYNSRCNYNYQYQGYSNFNQLATNVGYTDPTYGVYTPATTVDYVDPTYGAVIPAT